MKKENINVIGIAIGMFFFISVILFKQYNFGGAGEYVIDTEGKVISSNAFNFIGRFTDTGFAYAEWNEGDETLCGYIDNHGKLIGGKKYKVGEIDNQTVDGQEFFLAVNGEMAEIYNLEGMKTGEIKKPYLVLCFQKCGLASVCNSKDGVGCVDETGTFVIEPKYKTSIFFDDNGIAVTEDVDGNSVCLSSAGEAKFTLYDVWIGSFLGEQFALAGDKESGLYGYVNQSGEYLVEPCFSEARGFSEGYAAVMDDNGKWGFIDSNGKIVISPQYESVGDFKEGVAAVKNSQNLVGVVNKDNNYVIEPKYQEIMDFSQGYAVVEKQNGKYTYVDKNGVEMNEEYDSAGDFGKDKIARVKKDGLFGYIKTDGTWLLKPQFDTAFDYHGGYAVVKLGLWQKVKKGLLFQ